MPGRSGAQRVVSAIPRRPLPALGGATHVTDKESAQRRVGGTDHAILLPHAHGAARAPRSAAESCLSAYRQELSRLWTFCAPACRTSRATTVAASGSPRIGRYAAFPGRFLALPKYEEFVQAEFLDSRTRALLERLRADTWSLQCSDIPELTAAGHQRARSGPRTADPETPGVLRRYAAHLAHAPPRWRVADRSCRELGRLPKVRRRSRCATVLGGHCFLDRR